MDGNQLKFIIEAALLAAGRPLSLNDLQGLFGESDPPARQDIRSAVMELQADYADRGISLREVASGFRVQIDSTMSQWLARLWEQRPPRFSRALMETLAIIAYRQPVTRGDIEEIRGVSVTSNIIRTLLERNWIRVVGHRDVPGKPAMFGTTREFLDYFNLKKLDDLPTLQEIRDLDASIVQLGLPEPGDEASAGPDDHGAPLPVADADEDSGQDDEAPREEAGAGDTAGDTQEEQSTVSSIEDARAAREAAPRADGKPATIVPLKTS